MVRDNSAAHSYRILIGQLKRKSPESYQNNVKKLTQTNQKLCPGGNGTMHSTVSGQHASALSRNAVVSA